MFVCLVGSFIYVCILLCRKGKKTLSKNYGNYWYPQLNEHLLAYKIL